MAVGRKDTGLLTTFDQNGVNHPRGWQLPLGDDILWMTGPFEVVPGQSGMMVRAPRWTLKLATSGEVVAFTGLEQHLEDDLLRIAKTYPMRKSYEYGEDE